MELLKYIGEKVEYDKEGQHIWGVSKNGSYKKIADIRGWGAIQNLFINWDRSINLEKAVKFQDDLGKFIQDAINEKIERDSKK
ncbi:MAG: hypothetical protein AABY22_01740 [Nanoarchaeota archaeon]